MMFMRLKFEEEKMIWTVLLLKRILWSDVN